MNGASVLFGVSLLLRLGAAVWPIVAFRRLGEKRLLGLSLVGFLLLAEGGLHRDPDTAALSLGVSVLALTLVVGAIHVLARRLRTYRSLQESEELNRLTLSSVSDAVFISDDQGVITHVWPGCAEFFDRPTGTVGRGSRVEELLGTDPVDRERLVAEGEISNVPLRIAGSGKGDRRLLVTIKRVDIQGGTTLFACRDVTEITRVETALEEALAEVQSLKDRYEAEAHYLQDEIRTERNVEGIIGSSPRLVQMLRAVETVAATESTVLIRGETGAGKELVARALHQLSPRSDRPLIKVNCATLPANLVESELFGHERGAFTGALERKLGRFELAHHGTLFLDEIGELPLELQPKLLRVLQEGEFQRVGGSETIRVDVRVLAATNRALRREVAEGRFRSDLYYRLEVFPVVVPPLRERAEDIPVLATHFLHDIASVLGRDFQGFTTRSLDAMCRYGWPGNVRELRNVVERAAIVARGDAVDVTPFLGDSDGSPPAPRRTRRLEDVEREHVVRVLQEVGWKVEGPGGAAEILDLNPSTLRGRMRKLGIRRPTS